MKKFLLVLAAMLLFSMTARAKTCPSGQYWNSVEFECDSCQKADGYSDQCLECKEGFKRKGDSTIYAEYWRGEESYPICTKLKSDAYFVNDVGKITFCGAGGVGSGYCKTDHCTSEFTSNGYRYSGHMTCKDGCLPFWYSTDLGLCEIMNGHCTKAAGDGEYGRANSHNGKKGFYCVECSPGYTLITRTSLSTHTKCCNGEHVTDCYESGEARICEYGYIVSNGECVKKPTCSNGQYTASDGTCQPCSNISVPNGSCLSCSSSSQCDNISCNTGYVKKGSTCVKAATCTYPLKEVADYSGECVGCCTD